MRNTIPRERKTPNGIGKKFWLQLKKSFFGELESGQDVIVSDAEMTNKIA